MNHLIHTGLVSICLRDSISLQLKQPSFDKKGFFLQEMVACLTKKHHPRNMDGMENPTQYISPICSPENKYLSQKAPRVFSPSLL